MTAKRPRPQAKWDGWPRDRAGHELALAGTLGKECSTWKVGRKPMSGSLNEILPDRISEADELVVLELLKRKMTVVADIAVELLHATEKQFGPKARDVARAMIAHQEFDARREVGEPEADLREFCAMVDRSAVGTHEWTKTDDKPQRVTYTFTRCLYAEIFREVEEP
jgi:hypothetical protein